MNTRLEHWSLRSRPLGLVEAPEQEDVCLFGVIVGHPFHRDGKEVLTSPVRHYRANRIVTKSGSEYELGSVDPSYERCYPAALQRLLSCLATGPQELTCAALHMG